MHQFDEDEADCCDSFWNWLCVLIESYVDERKLQLIVNLLSNIQLLCTIL